jgi:hypothetical protein
MDVLMPIGDQLILGFGDSNNAVQANQNHREDDSGFDLDVAIHSFKVPTPLQSRLGHRF